MATSPSVEWRQKGNDVYKTVTDGLSPVIQKERLNSALNYYQRALNAAATPNERSSAAKNLAKACWKMAPVVKARDEKPEIIRFYFKEALKYFRDARSASKDQKLSWLEDLLTSAIMCWTEFLGYMDNADIETRIRELHVAVDYVIDDVTRAEAYLEIAGHYFHAGISALQEREYKKSLSLLKDCCFPLNEAKRLGTSSSGVLEGVEHLERDFFVQMCITESIKARVTGDELLSCVIRDEEVLNIDMVWEITDWYRTAIMLTRESDLEMEAIAHSRLGRVYDQVLMMKDKAKENFNRCLHLANLMVPRTFHSEDWLIYAKSALRRYQQQTVREEEIAKQEERAKVNDEIKDDLTKINSTFEKSTKMEFLEFLYKTYPPTNSTYKKEALPDNPDIKGVNKVYCKAVTHYHPDKVDVEKHGLKWKVLSGEITKLLTMSYEDMK
ncbi:uncharacterized protein LOC124151971 [Haliotis rufescens]|uniref:uncharacterized protein LOC124151971 n=1 Tax=Haliotis rufescens TaxID=6454 RepID=UPI00201F4957|nr:uncharacterized protein LOC124151971 [Haliotis rufescens]XP_046380641.2 uncharacterized protein LOC124151971 [Haliotis rufescens]